MIRLLFPLDRSRGLRGNIVKHVVDALDLACDARGDLCEHVVGDGLDGRAHRVLGVDGADDRRPALVSGIVLNANALDVGDNDKILPYLLGKSANIEFLAEYRVCLAERVETVAGDRAKASYALNFSNNESANLY